MSASIAHAGRILRPGLAYSVRCPPVPPDPFAAWAGAPRILRRRQAVFRAGQAQRALHLVRSGVFKTVLLSEDGRESITGFAMRGDLLGLESIGLGRHACDAIALDTGEVRPLPLGLLGAGLPWLDLQVAARLATALRADAARLLALATRTAEQRLAGFLLELAHRLGGLGYSRRSLLLKMSRAEIGQYLGMNLETVTRALSRLDDAGLVAVRRRDIRLLDPVALHALRVRTVRSGPTEPHPAGTRARAQGGAPGRAAARGASARPRRGAGR